jgi:hypothetical protein
LAAGRLGSRGGGKRQNKENTPRTQADILFENGNSSKRQKDEKNAGHFGYHAAKQDAKFPFCNCY